jgi:RHS repeat-associated protein
MTQRPHLMVVVGIVLFLLSKSVTLQSQIPDPVTAAEAPVPGSGHSYVGVGAETVNPADGSLSFDLPIQPPTGRQLSMKFGIRFSGSEQFYVTNQMYPGGLQYLGWVPNWQNGQQAPWQLGAWSYDLPIVTYSKSVYWTAEIPNNGCPNGQCTYALNLCYGDSSYVFRGLDGVQYSLPIGTVYPGSTNSQPGYCPTSPNNIKSPGNAHGIFSTLNSTLSVFDHSGTTYQFPVGNGDPGEPAAPQYYASNQGALASSITDRNGNEITLASNGLGYQDSTGRAAVSWSGIGNSGGDTINVSGLSGPVKLYWTTTPVSFPETGHNVGTSSCSLSGVNQSLSVVNEISLPNGQSYTFQYDGTYGKISKITFPDGGYVRYVWGLNHSAKAVYASWSIGTSSLNCSFIFDIPAVTDRYVSYDGSTEVLHQHFVYSTTWSGINWTLKSTTMTATDLLTQQATTTIYTYGAGQADNPAWGGLSYYTSEVPVENSVVYKNGSGTTYKTVNNAWRTTQVLASDQTILDNSQGTTTLRCFDPNEQVTNIYEYGYQSEGSYPGNPSCTSSSGMNTGALGPLRRHTTNAYHPFWNNSLETGTHILNAPDSVTVANGSGTTGKQVLYTYDQSTPTSSGAINLSNPGTTRANATTIQQWISGSTYATTTLTYYDTGQVYTKKDACGNTTCSDMSGSSHTTTYSYSDNYAAGTGSPTGQTFAYLTQVTDPLSHTNKFSWGFNDGLVRSQTDPNNLTTSYAYSDPLARVTQISYPDGGQTNVLYNDSTYSSSSNTPNVQTSGTHLNKTTITARDGLSHPVRTMITSDPQGTIYSDTTYDGVARVWKKSNPYRNSDPTSSPGTTVYAYDPVDRKISETYPDNAVLTTAYCGPTTLVTDPTGHWRRSRTDGLGFLFEVDEPNAPGATVNVCPGTGEPIWVTAYGNDLLGNLATVVQNGSHSRSFTYDGLSHLLCSSNPENSSASCPANGGTLPTSGAVLYAYDVNGNVSTKKDSRSITTTYSYDVVNRPLTRSYSNGDPTVSTTYDQSNCLSLSACQNIGYRTSMTDAAGSESWAYQVDSAHSQSIHQEQRTTNSVTKPSIYYLDQAANLKQMVYPTGRTVNYTYDAANRSATAADASSGNTYVTAPISPLSGCISGGVCYTPQGSVYSMSIGQVSGFTGLNVSETFNSRLQPNEIKASSTAGSALDITYTFTDPSSHNAGHVWAINNLLNSSRSQSFNYDQLNRIISAGTYATTGSYCWGYQYSYDAWGNLNSQAGWSPTYNSCAEYTMSTVSADGNNHLPGLSYDAAGNTLSDGINSYTWDGESEIKTAAGVTYIYDGDGRRAEKSNGKLYWYGSGGEILAETNSSGTVTAEYVFFGGRRVATLPAGTTAQYYVEDFLGSSRVVTTNTGSVCYDADLTPYGAEKAYTNTCTQNAYKFEGKERDAETGNDEFGARYYTWRMGRWLSSDWSSVPGAVPYAKLTNPQTLNLYAMVVDDPESFADLDGHCPGQPGCDIVEGLQRTVTDLADGTSIKNSITNGLSTAWDNAKSLLGISDGKMTTLAGTTTLTAVSTTGNATIDSTGKQSLLLGRPDASVGLNVSFHQSGQEAGPTGAALQLGHVSLGATTKGKQLKSLEIGVSTSNTLSVTVSGNVDVDTAKSALSTLAGAAKSLLDPAPPTPTPPPPPSCKSSGQCP